MHEALTFVEQRLRSAHAGSRDGFGAEIEDALVVTRQNLEQPRSAASFGFVLNEWLTRFGDAHTVVRWRDDEPGRRRRLNLPLAWNEHGLFLVENTGRFARGDRVISIGGLDEATVLRRLRRVIPSENDHYLRGRAARLLPDVDTLEYLGAERLGDRYEVIVVSADDARHAERLQWQDNGASPTIRDNVRYRIWPDDSLAVFRFDRFEYDAEMAHALEAFFEAVMQYDIRKVAIDIRDNPGGDSAVAFAVLEHFADFDYRAFSVDIRVSKELDTHSPHFSISAMNPVLQQFGLPAVADDADHYRLEQALIKPLVLSRLDIVPPGEMVKVANRELYLMIDGLTFSSGNLFATLVRDNRLGTLVGEPTGNRVNFFGSELRFDIPHTGFYLNLSTAQMLRPDESLPDAATIQPDIGIPLTPQAARAGADPVLDYLRER